MPRLRKLLALATTAAVFAGVPSANAGLYFSEYVEGSSFYKCIEIFNGTGADVDLSFVDIRLYSNGAASPTSTATLSGTLLVGDVFVVCNPSIATPEVADLLSGVVNYNGDDAFELVFNGVTVDVIGQIGFDPGTGWGVAPVTTLNATLRRLPNICEGDANGFDAFDPSLEWEGFPIDTLDGLGTHDGCGVVSNEVDSWSAVKALFQ
jgi:predicted extracellular nuclease